MVKIYVPVKDSPFIQRDIQATTLIEKKPTPPSSFPMNRPITSKVHPVYIGWLQLSRFLCRSVVITVVILVANQIEQFHSIEGDSLICSIENEKSVRPSLPVNNSKNSRLYRYNFLSD